MIFEQNQIDVTFLKNLAQKVRIFLVAYFFCRSDTS